MNITKFNEKLNKLEGNTYTIEEVVTSVNGVYEADLRHDNVEPNTINVYTGSKLTGDKINSYTISTPSLTPWRTHIKIYSNIFPLYITYETIGDTVEADDINNVQNAINYTQNALNNEITRATKAENTITSNLNNEITRAKNAEKQLQTNIDNEVKRGKDAEKQLQTNLDTEVTRATNAENTLTANLNNEVTRAKNAENTLTTNLSNEVTRAKKAENGIQNIINTNKPKWDDKYTKAEIDNKIDSILTDTVWKDAVSTFADLATTYPNPQVGWTVYVEDTGYTYRYDNGSWVKINSYNLPLATSSRDGRMSKEDKSFLDSVKSMWTNITTHITDTAKHITSAERTLWNTVSSKLNKSGDTMTGTLSIKKSGNDATLLTFDTERPWSFKQGGTGADTSLDLVSSGNDKNFRILNADKTKGLDLRVTSAKTEVRIDGNKVYHSGDKPKLSELTNDAGFITRADVDTTQNHTHSNKAVLDKITEANVKTMNDVASGIGGRNLYTGTKDFTGTWLAKSEWSIDSDKYKGFTVLKKRTPWGGVRQRISAVAEEKYVLSAYVKCELGSAINGYGRGAIEPIDKNRGDLINSTEDATEWRRITFPFVVTKSGDLEVRFENSVDKAFYICGLKLEKGTIATDWSPAPEDMLKKGMTWAELEGK